MLSAFIVDKGVQHQTLIAAMDFLLQGNLILTASWVPSDALQLWDYRKHELLKNLTFVVKDRGHVTGESGDVMAQGAYLYCGQFCTSSVVVAGGTGTNSVQAVCIDTDEVRLTPRRPMIAVCGKNS